MSRWLIEDYHSERVKEQELDETYYNDSFECPNVRDINKVIRLGTGADLVDTPAEQIITSNPKVYVEAVDRTKASRDNALKRGALLNHWAKFLTRQSPQPYKEAVKNALLRGEAWIHPVSLMDYNIEYDIPIYFSVPDPLTVFGHPNERNGIPEYVVVSYMRDVASVRNKYEHWTNPKNAGEGTNKKLVRWQEWWSAKERWFAADDEPVTGFDSDGQQYVEDGIETNVLGFVPFVHGFAGFGKASSDGDPVNLAVGRIRKVRGRILEETEVESSWATAIHRASNIRTDVKQTTQNAPSLEKFEYDPEYGALNRIPFGIAVEEHFGQEPSPQTMQHLATIRSYISKENPPILSGIASGTSGRQEDIIGAYATHKYDSLVDNIASMWAQSFGMGLRMLRDIPGMMDNLTVRATKLESGMRVRDVTSIKREDLDDLYCEFKLKASDPVEEDRKALMGDTMQLKGIIDWETNLTEYHSKSVEEAQEIMTKVKVDEILKTNPVLNEMLGREALKYLGMDAELQALEAETQNRQMIGESLGKAQVPGQPGARGGEPRKENIQNDESYQMADMMMSQMGQRRPPQ